MKIFRGGGIRSGEGGRVGGQGRCVQRSEVFVKNKKKMWRGVQVWGGGGGGGVGVGWGVRVDVNKELKFLCKFKKNIFFGRGGGGGGRVGM